jgi:DNA-binding MarR family transcriptional regulator
MRSAVLLRQVADQEITDRLLAALRKNPSDQGMMIRELATAAGISTTTAGKYVDVCQMAGWVDVKPFATAKLVKLTPAGRAAGAGRGPKE